MQSDSSIVQTKDACYHPAPTPAQLALAVAVIRTKPPQTCIDDYIGQFSRHVHNKSLLEQEQNVEAVSFWKESYERVEAEKELLLDRIFELEHRDEINLSDLFNQSSKSALNSKKRKLDNNILPKANTQFKRSRIDKSILDDTSKATQGETFNQDSRPELKRMLRATLALRRSLTKANCDSTAIHNSVAIICQAVVTALARTTQNSRTNTSDQLTDQVDSVITCSKIRLIYPCILQALSKMESLHTNENDQDLAEIASSRIVYMFKTILGHLHELALGRVTRIQEEELRRTKPPKSNMKVTKEKPEEAQEAYTQSCSACSELLVTMIASINPMETIHCELLEGLLCALLDHIGSSLALLVFSNHDTFEVDDVGILPPEVLLHVAHVERSAEIAAAKLEAPYLIYTLKNVIGFLREQRPHLLRSNMSDPSGSDRDQLDQTSMLQKLESMLQNTLMRGVFGDDDVAFENSLRRVNDPPEPLDDILEEIEEEAETSEWFISQVWEILGWDVLAGTSVMH